MVDESVNAHALLCSSSLLEEGPGRNQSLKWDATEPLVNVLLGKLSQRSKLQFGAVEVGLSSKVFPVNVVIPNGKEASEDAPLMLHVHQSYTKGGQQQPEVLDASTGQPIQYREAISIPAGQDRARLLVRYAPAYEDPEGALGSIALHCIHAGMLLKAELSYSARPVYTPKAGPVRKAGTSGSLSVSCRLPAPGLPLRSASLKAPLPSSTRSTAVGRSSAGAGATEGPDVHRRASADGASLRRDSTLSSKPPLRTQLSKPRDTHAAAAGGSEEDGGTDVQLDSSRKRDQGPPLASPTAMTSATDGIAHSKPRATKQLFPPSQPHPQQHPQHQQGSLPAMPSAQLPPQHDTDGSATRPHPHAAAAVASTPAPAAKTTSAAPRPPRMPHQPRPSLNLTSSSSMPSQRHSHSGCSTAAAASMTAAPAACSSASGTPKRPCVSASPSVYSSPQRGSPSRSLSGSCVPQQRSSPSRSFSGSCVPQQRGSPSRSLSGSCVPSSQQVASGLQSASKTSSLRGTPTKAGVPRPDSRTHLERHTEAPMVKQERALCAWLNSQLSAYHVEFNRLQAEAPQGQALTMQRLTAQARGLLWRQFKKSAVVYDTLKKPFAKIDAGVFNLTEALVKECLLFGREMNEGLDKAACWLEHRDALLKNFLQLVLLLDRTMSDPDIKLPRGSPPLFSPHARLKSSKQPITSYSGTVVPTAREMVDANRDVTLGVLWRIALKWQVPRLLSSADLAVEVRRLLRLQQCRSRRPVPAPVSLCPQDKRADLLLKWVQAACGLHGLRIHDASTSFGDGRALCYLFSTYLPDWLPAESIYQPSVPNTEDLAVLLDGDEEADIETLRSKGWCAVYEAGGCIDDQGQLKAYREGIRHNFSLLHECAGRLGRVPQMLSPDDFIDGGVECHIVSNTCSGCMCGRKGPFVKPAAVVLQKYWRKQLACREVAALRREAMRAAERAAQAAQRARERAEAEAAREAERCAIAAAKERQRIAIAEEERRQRQAAVRAAEQARLEAEAAAERERLAVEQARLAAEAAAEQARLEAEAAAERERLAAEQAQQEAQAAAEQQRLAAEAEAERERRAAAEAAERMRIAAEEAVERERVAKVQAEELARAAEEAARERERVLHAAATSIQAAWRGYCVQRTDGPLPRLIRRVLVKHQELVHVRYAARAERAAVVLQASWRMHACRAAYLAQRQQVVFLQSLLRMHTHRVAYLELRGATVLAQRTWRSAHAKSRARAAAAHERARVAAALHLQAVYRGKRVHDRWLQQRAAVMALQAAWRTRMIRLALHKQHAAATSIQASWRMHAARQHLVAMATAAAVMQAHVRGLSARRAFAALQHGALVAQAAWRALAARKQLSQVKRSATALQVAWRARTARVLLRDQRDAAVYMQSLWRARVAMDSVAHTLEAAMHLQAAWRGRVVRQKLAQCQHAGTVVQAGWRAYVQRKCFVGLRDAVVVMQAGWRAKAARAEYVCLKAAAVKVQAAWKCHAAQRQLRSAVHAATAIQCAWRRHAVQAQLVAARRGAVHVQAAVRCLLARKAYEQQRDAAVQLQSLWRGRQVRAALHRQHQAATSVARAWRGFQARRHWGWARRAATTIQASMRMWSARRQFCACKQAAIQLQAVWRACQARKQLQQHVAAVRIQAAWRGHVVRADLQRKRAAAMQIQATCRMLVHRRCYLSVQLAAVVLQARARARTQRVHLCAMRSAADQICAAWRRRAAAAEFAALRQAACVVQAAHRARAARQVLHQQRVACVAMQACWRARLQRHAYCAARASVVVLQAHARGWETRKCALERRAAIAVVQNAWRARCARCQLQQLREQHAAATMLQAYVRRHQARKAAHARQQAIVAIQAWVRGLGCRRRLAQEKAILEFEATAKAYMHRYQSASRIQACMRGFLERQRTGPEVETAIVRVRTARAVLTLQTAIRAWAARRTLQQCRAALMTISAHVPQMRARMVVLRARRQAAQQQHAAVLLQSGVRMWLARKQKEATLQGIARLQVCRVG
ncbi:hypothetical protein DUNSADRAFT_14022 [Dunaliella salina]|uniref:Calponin-homology (CH) domain-containing protein n=1 Tax=Dunaliella salina TaxID=3046 RepID=A0ABQ7H2V7_DUNSA|nr:hypothetical protein DUNSADRAFT_14022 [Dunaliella salina]|eukprot:KAF5841191.1 hypothetical protein DUNSADRAFT_14022 [Dunaliella salina]